MIKKTFTGKTVHQESWIEYEVPAELEDELTEYIENKLKEYRENCPCDWCQDSK